MWIDKKILLLLSILLIGVPSFAQSIETTSDKETQEDGIPVSPTGQLLLNQNLRYTERRLNDIENSYVLTTILDAKFDTTTGHDHDGTDSKTVVATNLDMTGITNGHYLYNNAGTLAGITSPGLSNVIYSWVGASEADTNIWGLVNSDSLTHGMSAYTKKYEYFGVLDNTYRTIIASKFIKIAGISTVTINARLWSNTTGATAEAVLSVDVGGQSNTVKSVTSNTPTWVTTSDIDVSSLTNGTTYDITIQLKNETNAGWSSYCSGVILTGS